MVLLILKIHFSFIIDRYLTYSISITEQLFPDQRPMVIDLLLDKQVIITLPTSESVHISNI